MSDRYVGGIIKGDGTELTTSRFGTASGMFTLGQQLNAFQAGTWPSDYDIVQEFSASDTWTCPAGVGEIAEYLIIAGGGGGADTGGGGAGGFRTGTGIPVIAGKTYEIGIGSGGSAGGNNSGTAGGNGNPSGFITEANVRYYVSVGNPGAGNRYFIKTEQTDSAEGNVAAVTQLLYEGSTYVFDQSHPTNSGHPFRFSETPNGTHATPAGSEYTTGVTTNQPSVAAGTPASAVQIQVASPAPELYYYCSVHPNMGGAINTLANVSVMSVGGGGGGAGNDKAKEGGSGGGGGGVPTVMPGGRGTPGDPTSVAPAFQGHNGGASTPTGGYNGGGGGGAGQPGFDGRLANFPVGHGGNGGNGLSHSISGSTRFFSGGGGGAAEGQGGIGGGGNAHYSTAGGRPATPRGEGGNANSGGGGGGTWEAAQEGGGSGIVFIKYKNNANTPPVFTFKGSGTFTNIGGKEIEYLVVAGGGAGGALDGGGGGAGGLLTGTLALTSPDQTLPIVIGAGGATGGTAVPAPNGSPNRASNGNSSSIGPISTVGGGGGGSHRGVEQGHEGGSGGGSSHTPSGKLGGPGTPGQGNTGGTGYPTAGSPGAGNSGGGGGGAGEVGNTNSPSAGGDGLSSSITGTSTFYAGGGGGGQEVANGVDGGVGGAGGGGHGGRDNSDTNLTNGEANTGGGGGGGGYSGGGGGPGATGGSGIVVIKITG